MEFNGGANSIIKFSGDNLSSIGTISSGAITSSGYITMNGDTKKYAAPVYRDSSGTSVNNSGFTTLFTVAGSALASTIRMTLAGTTGSVVVNVTADITVGHYQDILITSQSGFYTTVTLKVISDDNDDFAVQAKTNHANGVTLAIEVFPLNNESVTFTTSHSFTGSSHEHTCHYGTHTSGTGGNSGDLTVNGRTFLQDGSIASPALTFRNDHNTGIYRVGSDQIGWVSGGSRKFYINASRAYFQNLSEGVDVPSLRISGTTVIDSSRNITANSLGINKSSPVGRLDVHQTLDAPSMCITSSNPSQWGASLLIGNTVADQTLVDANDRPMIVLDGKYPVFNMNHTVNNNSNHGPTIQFTFDGLTTGGSTGRQILIGTSGTGSRLDFGFSGGALGSNTDKNPHNGIAGYNGVTPMRLFSNGLLLGTTGTYPNEIASVSNALEVVGNIKCTETILKTTYNEAVLLYSSGTSSSGSAIGFQQATAEGWSGIFVDYNPNEGWGLYHDNPSNYFYITAETTTGSLGTSFTVPNRNSGSSTAYAKIRFDQNNGNINAGGAITANGNVTAYASDRRLKTNFRQIESAVDKVKKLNGMIFDWNDVADANGFTPDRKHDDIGLIAQEVQEIVPQAVELAPFDTEVISTPITKGDKNGGNIDEKRSISGEDYLTVNYSKLVPLLVNAIKEQSTQITAQQEQINELTKLVNALMEK